MCKKKRKSPVERPQPSKRRRKAASSAALDLVTQSPTTCEEESVPREICKFAYAAPLAILQPSRKLSMTPNEKTTRTPVKSPKLLRYALMKEIDFKKHASMKHIQTQTTLTALRKGVVFEELTDEALEQDMGCLKRNMLTSAVFKDDKKCKFYTGLSLVGFGIVLNFVQKAAGNMTYWRGDETVQTGAVPKRHRKIHHRLLTVKDELLLTLIRLRRGLEIEILSDLMGISCSLVSRVMISWIHLLSRELLFLIKWPTRQQILSNFPRSFRYFLKTRVIIDCTEFQLQRPSLPSVQRKSYSTYKHRNTAKCLLAVTPRGTFCFVSDLWTGSISDRKIVEKSGFLDLIEEGDDVMADRGFLIRDLLILRKATLNIPPFANGRQLTQVAVTKTRRIAATCRKSYWSFETVSTVS